MTDLEMWAIAWANIQADYQSGRISRAQFLKEREYMWEGRRQILRGEA